MRRFVVKQGSTRFETSILRFTTGTLTQVNGETVIDVSAGGASNHATLTHLGWTAGGHNGTASRIAWFDSGGSASYLGVGSGLTVSGSSLVVDTGTIATLAAVSAGYQPLNSSLTAISGGTWAGSTSITTMGTIATGVWQGTAIGTAYGGTGASTPSGARSNLGLVIGADVQAWDADLDALAALGNGFPYRAAGTWGATAAGDLAVSAGSIQVTQARGLRETFGPTTLAMGAVADGALLVRSGTSVIGSLFSDLMATYSAFLVALRGLSTNGFLVRGGAGTAYARTITAGAGVTITNGDGTGGNPVISASGSGGATGTAAAVTTYGGAFDGAVTFDTAGATPTGWTKSGSTYTRDTASGECQYSTVTFAQDSIILDVAGSPFRCRSFNPTAKNGIAVVNVGSVGVGGGSGGAAGTGAAPATLATSSAGSVFYGGTDGGAGGNVTNGANATSAPAGTGYGGGLGGAGGRARFTSVATIRTGGTAGTGTNAGSRPQFYGNPWSMISGGLLAWRNGTTLLQIAGGTGGGGGGSSNAGRGGGGGGGSGVLLFAAETAVFGTGCYFSVDGAAGGAGAVGTTVDADAGGGGGGGGRMMVAIGTISGSNLPSFYGRGGTGGAGVIGAAGTGWAEGGNGGSGGRLEIYIGTNSVGGTPTILATGGPGGANAGSGTGYVGSVAGSDGTYKYGEGT